MHVLFSHFLSRVCFLSSLSEFQVDSLPAAASQTSTRRTSLDTFIVSPAKQTTSFVWGAASCCRATPAISCAVQSNLVVLGQQLLMSLGQDPGCICLSASDYLVPGQTQGHARPASQSVSQHGCLSVTARPRQCAVCPFFRTSVYGRTSARLLAVHVLCRGFVRRWPLQLSAWAGAVSNTCSSVCLPVCLSASPSVRLSVHGSSIRSLALHRREAVRCLGLYLLLPCAGGSPAVGYAVLRAALADAPEVRWVAAQALCDAALVRCVCARWGVSSSISA
jgi:hypothetical protein